MTCNVFGGMLSLAQLLSSSVFTHSVVTQRLCHVFVMYTNTAVMSALIYFRCSELLAKLNTLKQSNVGIFMYNQ